MVLCIAVGCGNRSGRDKGIDLARVPTVVRNQGEEAEILSQERRSRWISAISKADLTNEILHKDGVCGKHFVSGQAAKAWDRHNVDWVPTLNLGHDRKIVQNKSRTSFAARAEGKRERELSLIHI